MMKTLRKLAIFIMALALCLGLFAGCTSGKGGSSDEILIGGLFNLTGDQASVDNPSKKAMEMAFEEINAAGGVLGKQIKMIVEDCKTDQTASTNAAEKLISQDKVVMLAGLADSTFVLAAGAIAQKYNIPFIECGGTMPSLPDEVGDCLYMACFGDNVQAYAGVDYAVDVLGAKTAWLFVDTATDYTVTLAKFYRERLELLAGPGSVILEDTYQTSDVDFKAQISRLKALPEMPDVLLVTADPSCTGAITKQIREMGIDIPIVGGDGFDTPLVVEGAGELATDLYFTTHVSWSSDNPLVPKFIEAYKAKYGVEPETSFAALGYDTAYLLADAIKRAGSTDPDAIKKALSETKDLPGVAGAISFTGGSRVPVKSVTIMKIQKGVVSFVQEITP